jgi:hypothetical protein
LAPQGSCLADLAHCLPGRVYLIPPQPADDRFRVNLLLLIVTSFFEPPVSPGLRIIFGGGSPGSQNNSILLVGERIFVDDFSGQYFLRNALRKCLTGGFSDEAMQLLAKSAEVGIAQRIP